MKKRVFSVILCLAAFLTLGGTARAVSEKITTGTSPTEFSPNRICTESEILTFLWRAYGSPATDLENPFTNVGPAHYYYQSALWAYENRMLTGSIFDATKPCTRSTAVTYLWQAAGRPETARDTPFVDIPADENCRKAIAWAVEKQITNGTNGTAFSPDEHCTRAQIAAFLYRSRGVNTDPPVVTEQDKETEADIMPQMQIEVGGQTFTATLLDNPTTRALLERLPMTVSMEELNGNEKYYYLPSPLPTNSERPGNIHAGDLMLYGSDCLVLFYESFSSGYSYTRLGSIDNPAGLADALGTGNAEVRFQVG